MNFDAPWALLLLPPVVALAVWIGRTSHGAGGARLLSTWRQRVVRILRPTSAALLVLALAGLSTLRREDRLTVIFAVDASRSVGGASHGETFRWLAEAADRIPEGDRAGVVAFGREAMVDALPDSDFRGGEVLSRPADSATDLGAAVRLARGLLPPQQEARLVLLTDGVETRGSIEQVVAALPPEIDVVWAPLEPAAETEVAVEQIALPERVVEGEPHRVRVVLRAARRTRADLRLYRGPTPIAAVSVELEPEQSQVFAFDQVAPPGAGLLLYRAQVTAAGDATPENNHAEALVKVEGRPSVLVVDREPRAIAPLVRALEQAGMRVISGGPGALPASVQGLAAYGGVVLSDVAADRFSAAQLAALSTWVEDLGGGLLMLGGPEGFGRGGWWQTPVEEVLPLSMTVKDHSYFPSVGLVLCLDKSGSMAGSAGVQKIEMAKAAAAGVVELLEPMDHIGVVAFDAAAKWVVPMTPGGEKEEILDALGTLRAGGGTDAYPAMELAFEALEATEARIKHVILLTDGQLVGRDHEGLSREMVAAGVTVSTVGIGTDADLYTLDRIAQEGGGSFYHAADIESVPRIFLKDAFRVARSWLVEETFQPVRLASHPAIAGLTSLPALDGYVAASEKPGAEHLLASHLGDPLLSLWRIGLGKSVAFTSDAKARWAGSWLRWPGYGATWAAWVRWTIRDPAAGRLRVQSETTGGRLRLAADLLDAGGALVNGARLSARVVGPDGRAVAVELEQEGPGRYAGEVEAAREGPYLAAVMRDGGGTSREGVAREAATVAALVPYADEFRGLSRAPDALERLVATGRVRKLESADELFHHRGTGGLIRRSLVPALLALVAILLVLEVAVRKLALPAWLERCRATERPAEARLTALSAARRRATRHVLDVTPTAAAADAVNADVTVEAGAAPDVEVTVHDQVAAPPLEAEKPARDAEGDGYTSRLLAAKRRMRSGRRSV